MGYGSYGEIYLFKGDDQLLVCKKMYKANLRSRNVDFKNEISIHKLLHDHKHIVQLLNHFETSKHIYIMMEYMEKGDLRSYILKSVNDCIFIIRQVVDAVHYCHQNKIIHRDIKTENILMTSNMLIKLCDFGLSKRVDDVNQRCNTICGTIEYYSPELVENKGYNYKNDTWCIGIVLYELYHGISPFENGDIQRNIVECKPTFNGMKEIISWFLQKDPQKRIDLSIALKKLQTNYYCV